MTSYEQIATCKPASIFDVVPRGVFLEADDKFHGYITGRNCYEWKYAISKWLQPRSILEIGVRFGYSLCAMAAASDRLESIFGFDAEYYEPGSNAIALRALDILSDEWQSRGRQVAYSIRTIDSKQLLHVSPVDLAHIDASHNYEICLHDLNLCRQARAILVDDWDTCEEDRKACRAFIDSNPALVEQVLHLPSIHGDLLILLSSHGRQSDPPESPFPPANREG